MNIFYHDFREHASKKRRAINTTLSETLSSHGRRADGIKPPGTAGGIRTDPLRFALKLKEIAKPKMTREEKKSRSLKYLQ